MDYKNRVFLTGTFLFLVAIAIALNQAAGLSARELLARVVIYTLLMALIIVYLLRFAFIILGVLAIYKILCEQHEKRSGKGLSQMKRLEQQRRHLEEV